MVNLLNKIISHYKIVQYIGSGGMGVLYLAEDLEISRKAVLKFLPTEMENDPEINLRFKREAQSAGSLSHPNIVTIYDVGVYENKTYIAMEYVEGETLREVIKSDELTIERITDISIQICEGLNEAHNKTITHRDIKPENILIDAKGKVKIVDFGLAKVKNVSKGITKQNSTLGTIKYMSPEQIRNQNVDHRSDIWSFGVILYEMITGRYPFKGEHDASLFYSIINQTPEPVARYKSDINEGFQRIIDKSLDKDPETRYQHIDELLSDLRREKRDSGEFTTSKLKKKNTRLIKRISVISASLIAAVIIFIAGNYFLINRVKNVNPPKHAQLTFNGNIYIISGFNDINIDFAQISPDGQFTAYVVDNGSTQSIFVKENYGKQSFKIYDAKRIYCLKWSPNGEEIFFSAEPLDSNSDAIKISKNYSPYIISKFGGKPHSFDDPWWYVSWSPDGNSLAFIFVNNNSVRILDRKTEKEITAFKLDGDYTYFYDIDWSPKGDRFVCLTFNSNTKKYNIWTINAEGKQQKMIVESDKVMCSPRWGKDGNYIYYLQNRGITSDLVKIEISSFDESKSETLITGLDAYGFSITEDNTKLVYTKYFSYSNLWKLDYEKGTKSFQTKKLTNERTSITDLNISPDGNRIAFINQGNVYIKSINESESLQLTSFDSECSSVSWKPNGKEIAFFSGTNIVIVDAQAGIVQKTYKDVEFGTDLYWYSDSIIFYNDSRDYNFYVFNLITEEKRKFLKNDKDLGWIFLPRASPDKKSIAVFWNRWNDETLDGLWVISIDDSVQNHLRWKIINPLEWSEDGKYIYAIDYDRTPFEFLSVSSKTGIIKQRTKLFFNEILYADATQDGKILICSVPEKNSDVWMIENFDPDVE